MIVPAKNLIDQLILDIRNIAHDLSPPGLAMFGLFHAIDTYVSLLNDTGAIEIILAEAEGLGSDRIKLPEKEELALFRVITQLIANTLKHAEATKIHIYFKVIGAELEIGYMDNGKGFEPKILQERKGIGMQNIISRLQMINASHTLETSAGKGFKIDIRLSLLN